MPDSDPRTCLHGPCQCPVQGESSYCSDACGAQHRDAALGSGPCHCGHDTCPG